MTGLLFNTVSGGRACICVIVALLPLVFATGPTVACDVPVCQYALENWEPDTYEIVVFHHGPLAGEAKEAANLLAAFIGGGGARINAEISRVDLAAQVEEAAYPGADEIHAGEARLVLFPPSPKSPAAPLWDVPLSSSAVRQLVESPARQEIARRIIDGDSVVWVLLESGDGPGDEAAAATLEHDLQVLEDTLKLPAEYEITAATDEMSMQAAATQEPAADLSFSMVRVGRDSTDEAFLIASLCARPVDEVPRVPIAFPVFGRGRVLEGIAGASINQVNLRAACQLLIGACPCEVKTQSPGRDLLINADWTEGLREKLLIDVIDLPVLVGTGTLAEVIDSSPALEPAAMDVPAERVIDQERPDKRPESGVLLRNMIVALAGLGLAVGLLGVWILRRADG